jgi:hypothetical protein
LPGDGKVPAIAWREYQTRRATSAELEHWFGAEPMNIAVITGEISGVVRGIYNIDVVGESSRQSALKAARMCSSGRRSFRNPTIRTIGTPFACTFTVARWSGICQDDAVAYQPVAQLLIARRGAGICAAKLIGGSPEKPSIGVVLSLAMPEEILLALASNEQPF